MYNYIMWNNITLVDTYDTTYVVSASSVTWVVFTFMLIVCMLWTFKPVKYTFSVNKNKVILFRKKT